MSDRSSPEVEELLARIPVSPAPWRIEAFCEAVASRRGRPIVLHVLDLPDLPMGFWFDDGGSDHIVYRRSLSGVHRDHVILHELCHILAGHNQLGHTGFGARRDVGELRREPTACGRLDRQEEIAEVFASRILRLVRRRSAGAVTDFEQRAAAMFGAVG